MTATKKTDPQIILKDTRRLTGPNLFWDKPGAIIDVEISNLQAEDLIKSWRNNIRILFNKLGWENEKTTFRVNRDFISLVISAPIDVLYAATEVNECALEMSQCELISNENFELQKAVERLNQEIINEHNPALLQLFNEAKNRNICFLSDDEEVSVGYGRTALVFPVNQIPDVGEINWQSIKCIPVALVTGTNGKSTTVRLAASVAEAAGLSAGVTSTDYIRVGEKILDTGDYSGPGGARTLLRHPDTEVAFLEVARGGMLRRGLGVNQANVAVITNVAEDHLGEYGIETLDDMVEAKFIVRQSINNRQDLILNADDKGCVQFAAGLDNQIVWFSLNSDNSVITRHLENGGSACYLRENQIIYQSASVTTEIMDVRNVPLTFAGAAKHNIHNCMAVIAMSYALHLPLEAIQKGLTTFSSTPENNPGRGNFFEKDGIRVIVDFAHNEHGVSCMVDTINNLPSKRKLILIGQAGDRTDQLIESYINAALKSKPETLIICEMEHYLRGRQSGEVPKLIEKFALRNPNSPGCIIQAQSPLDGTQKALSQARPGDTLLLLALTDRDRIIDLLKENGYQ